MTSTTPQRPRGGGGSATEGSSSSSRPNSDIILVQVNQQKGSPHSGARHGHHAATGTVSAGLGDVLHSSHSRRPHNPFDAAPLGRDVELPLTADDLSESSSRSSRRSRRSSQVQPGLQRSCSNCGESTSRMPRRRSLIDPDSIQPVSRDPDATDDSNP